MKIDVIVIFRTNSTYVGPTYIELSQSLVVEQRMNDASWCTYSHLGRHELVHTC